MLKSATVAPKSGGRTVVTEEKDVWIACWTVNGTVYQNKYDPSSRAIKRILQHSSSRTEGRPTPDSRILPSHTNLTS